jgi:hypothetical protein
MLLHVGLTKTIGSRRGNVSCEALKSLSRVAKHREKFLDLGKASMSLRILPISTVEGAHVLHTNLESRVP